VTGRFACEMEGWTWHLCAPLSEPHELVAYPLLEKPMVVALQCEHPLGRSGRRGDGALSVKELAGETFIVYARQLGPALYEATMAACLKAGFSPRVGQEAPRVISALSLVAAGLGSSLVPACMQRMALEGILYRRIAGGAQPKAVLNLAARRGDTSPVVRRFLTPVRRAAREWPTA
jgi:DNA-binding transcriptional LysR family regulator